MAEALLRFHLRDRNIAGQVSSAGIIDAQLPVDPIAVDAMQGFGLDISGHRPRMITREILAAESPDLVITVSRAELRHVATLNRDYWGKSFTLKELVRRASEQTGGAFGSFAEWVHTLGADRRAADLLKDSPDDDIADPYGDSPQAVHSTAQVLDSLISHLVGLAPWPNPS